MKRTVSFIAAVCILFSFFVSGAYAFIPGSDGNSLDGFVSSVDVSDNREQVSSFLSDFVSDLSYTYVFYSSGRHWTNNHLFKAFIVSDMPFYPGFSSSAVEIYAPSGANIWYISLDNDTLLLSHFSEQSVVLGDYKMYLNVAGSSAITRNINRSDNSFTWYSSFDLIDSSGSVFLEANLELGSFLPASEDWPIYSNFFNGIHVVDVGVPLDLFDSGWEVRFYTSVGDFYFDSSSSRLLLEYDTDDYHYLQFNSELGSSEVILYAWEYYSHGDLLYLTPEAWPGLLIYPGSNTSSVVPLDVPSIDHDFSPGVSVKPNANLSLVANLQYPTYPYTGISLSTWPDDNAYRIAFLNYGDGSYYPFLGSVDIVVCGVTFDSFAVIANAGFTWYKDYSYIVSTSPEDWGKDVKYTNSALYSKASFVPGPYSGYDQVYLYFTDNFYQKQSLSHMSDANSSLVNIENALCSQDGVFAKFWFWLADYFSSLNDRFTTLTAGVYDIKWSLYQIYTLLSRSSDSGSDGAASPWFILILDKVKEYDLSVDGLKIKNYFYYIESLPWIVDPDNDGNFLDSLDVPLRFNGLIGGG